LWIYVGQLQDALYLIDVSQSVDLDHPHVLDFLREDAAHVNAFFARGGVHTGTVREVFEFVVDPSITDSNVHDALGALLAAAACRPPGFEDGEAAVADQVRAVPSSP
jgi:RIO kinase 1